MNVFFGMAIERNLRRGKTADVLTLNACMMHLHFTRYQKKNVLHTAAA